MYVSTSRRVVPLAGFALLANMLLVSLVLCLQQERRCDAMLEGDRPVLVAKYIRDA